MLTGFAALFHGYAFRRNRFGVNVVANALGQGAGRHDIHQSTARTEQFVAECADVQQRRLLNRVDRTVLDPP